MFPLGGHSIRVGVVGKNAIPSEQLSRGSGVGSAIDADSVSAETIRQDGEIGASLDCLLLDGSGFSDGGVALVERVREGDSDVPVLVLVDGEYEQHVPDLLSAGATDTIPRAIVHADPELVADRIETITEREFARSGLKSVYDEVAGTISLHDPDTGRMIHANRSLCDLLGYDRERLLSLRIGDVTADVPGYDHERAMHAVRSVAEQDTPMEVEWPLQTADGTVRWVEATLTPITFGTREFVLSASAEVTEQRRREREYEQVFDGVSDVITVHDPWAEEVTDVNETLCELTGYSHEALVEMDIGGLSADEEGFSSERAYEIQQRVAATGDPETIDWTIETANGERRQLECVLSPTTIVGEDRVLVIARDVTERRQLEQTYREVFENVSDGLVVHDPDTGEIQDVNERYCELTGYDRSELTGSNIRRIVPEESQYTMEEALDRIETAREEGPQLFEFGGQRKNGERFVGEVHLSTVELRGEERVLASVRDVTARRRREQAIHELQTATERMQDAESADDVARIAVETAAEALELPVTACWFHDAADKRLAPAVATEAVHDRELLTPLEADRYEYEVFQRGEVTTYTPHDENRDNPLETAILLPLGDHGLIAAGRPDRTDYDEATLNIARTLGAHTETALDRVERERDLRESEGRFRLIAERIDQVIFLSTPDFSETFYVNPAYEEVWGRPVENLYENPRGFVDHVDPRDREAFEADFERMLAEIDRGEAADNYEFEYRIRRPDDEVRWVRATGYPVEYQSDEPRFVGIVEDVTERRELERTYRSIFESVSDGLVLHHPETGEIIDVNDRFCEMHGYDRETLIDETIDLITGPDRAYEDALRRIEETREGEPQLFEWQNQRRDGGAFPSEVHLSTVDIRGEERILASVRDITERKRREREYEQIFDGVNDAIVIQDPETAEPLDANQTFLDRLGYDDVERIRQLGIEALSVTDAGYTKERAQELCHRVIETGEPETAEWQQETRDGERRWIEAKVDVATIGGEERIVSMQRDITERKRREREYEQIFNGVHDPITIHDPETAELLDVNDAFCDLLGYDREEIVEMGIEGYTPAERDYTMEDAREFVRTVVESGEPKQTEWAVETSDGELRWLEVKGTTVEIGGEMRYVSIDRDVTERRRSERRLRAILDRIDEAIFLARAHEITRAVQRPDYVSSGYEDIWGQSREAIRDDHEEGFFGTLHPDDKADYRRFMETIVAEIDSGTASDRYETEYRIRRPDGSVRWVQSEYYPVEWEGEPPRIVIVSRDVTERKERERRLVSFEEATDDLATADTPEEAARTAVDAAENQLDLAAVGVFLYDGDDGVLEPEVGSNALPGEVQELRVGPSDGALWEAFATGTVISADRTDDDGPADVVSNAPWESLADFRAIPLGNHGVLFVAARDTALGPDTIQSAHVLGATLEAALNHLRGERQLASQEEKLRTETERAERLDRLARLTQRVEAAITEESGPAAIERAVCERLVDTGAYEMAWIGGVEVGTDRLTPGVVIGESTHHVTAMDLLTTDEAADRHPAIEAWRTDEVQAVNSLVGDGPAGEWRRHVLEQGYQSLCSVPLTYDGVTHGVLTIAAETPNVFAGREREVLGQLGTSIGHALAGIERRRALESDETVELEFCGDGTELPFARLAREGGCRVEHERTVRREDGDVSLYFTLDGDPPEDPRDTAERTLPGSVEVVRDEPGAGSVLLENVAESWFGSPLAEYGAVLRRAEATATDTTVLVELPARSDLRSFTDRLQDLAPSLELEAKRQHQQSARTAAELRNRIEERLTERQHEALQTAFTAGYFEWPRESDGGDVADRLDITQPTFNKHLRLAERKTFETLFEGEA